VPVVDVYARLSKAADGETVKVDDQVELCTEKILDRGGKVGEVFKDNSLSAWNPKVVRPQWDALMARLEAGLSDGVMVYDLTRFSRKILEGERLVELAANGVRVWALAGEYDLTTADGRRHFREAMVAAAGESDKISERVQRGKLRRARKGRQHGGARQYGLPGMLPAPPGWEPGDPRELAPQERVAAERAVIRECYDRLFGGESVSSVVRDLNRRGVAGDRAALPTSGEPWRRGTLVRSMRRPALAGLLAHRGQVIGEFAGVEPIVSREEWERMRALVDARRVGRPAEPRHLLSGLITCSTCGTTLTGMPRSSLPPYPDGSAKREYRCRPARAHDSDPGCGRNHIDGLRADQAVAAAMVARLGDPRRAEHIAARLAAVREQRLGIEAEISRWEQVADDLVTKTASWGVARVDAAMAPILRNIEELRAALASLDEPKDPGTAGSAVAAWQEAVERGDIPAQRAMIRRAFPHLTIIPPRQYGDHSPERFRWDDPEGGDRSTRTLGRPPVNGLMDVRKA
jgi:DNA invertase Pin-like site-specific DNA recombinase